MENTNAVVTAMTTAVTTIASDCLSAIGAIIPVAAPILGAGLIITIAIRTVKKMK